MATTRALVDVLAREWSRTACPTNRARPSRSALVRIQAPVGSGSLCPERQAPPATTQPQHPRPRPRAPGQGSSPRCTAPALVRRPALCATAIPVLTGPTPSR